VKYKKIVDRYITAWEKLFWELPEWKREIVTGKYPQDDRVKVEFAKNVIQLAESEEKIEFFP
jgi:hypothetical protein